MKKFATAFAFLLLCVSLQAQNMDNKKSLKQRIREIEDKMALKELVDVGIRL